MEQNMSYRKSTLVGVIVLMLSSLSFAQQPYPNIQSEAKDSAMGVWAWTMSLGPMRKQVSMEIVEKEGKLVAIVVTPEGEKIESKDLVRKDDRIQFSIRKEEGGKAMTMNHDGKIKGDKIVGNVKVNGGPFDLSVKWDATRTAKKPATPK
jgi:hypothetical protein